MRTKTSAAIVLAGAFLALAGPIGPLGPLGPAPLHAQQAAGREASGQQAAGEEEASPWFPSRASFAPLLAAPREVDLRGSIIVADRDSPPGTDFEGTNAESEVAIGHQLPVFRMFTERGARPELTVGFEVGTFSRFNLEESTRDFINIDFRVGMPISLRWREWEGRVTLRHISSHLGDDFADRFDLDVSTISMDGFEFLVARYLLPTVRAYGGLEWNFHINPGVERTAGRFGAEWRGRESAFGRGEGGEDATEGFWPFAAAAFRVDNMTSEVAGTGTAGVAFGVRGVVLRAEARGHFGPTPMGQLRTVDEEFLGVGLRVEI